MSHMHWQHHTWFSMLFTSIYIIYVMTLGSIASSPLHQSLLKQVFTKLMSFEAEWPWTDFLLYWLPRKLKQLFCVYLSAAQASELGWLGSCIWTWQADIWVGHVTLVQESWFLSGNQVVKLVYFEEILKSNSSWLSYLQACLLIM